MHGLITLDDINLIVKQLNYLKYTVLSETKKKMLLKSLFMNEFVIQLCKHIFF